MPHPAGGFFPGGTPRLVLADRGGGGGGAAGFAQHPSLGALVIAQLGDRVAQGGEFDEGVAQLQLCGAGLLTQFGEVGIRGAGLDQLGFEPHDA